MEVHSDPRGGTSARAFSFLVGGAPSTTLSIFSTVLLIWVFREGGTGATTPQGSLSKLCPRTATPHPAAELCFCWPFHPFQNLSCRTLRLGRCSPCPLCRQAQPGKGHLQAARG